MNQPLSQLDERRQAIEAKIDTSRTAELALTGHQGGLAFRNVSEAMEAAKLMALSDKAVRPHLRGNPGACFGIIIQAVEWGMSPYAVANKSYLVNDQFAYESQLIQAVILRRAPIKGRIQFTYSGEGTQRICSASAVTVEGETVEYSTPPLVQISPKNSPLWKSDPDQQMAYMAGRNLCRRHFPDVLLGIYDRDEIENAPPMRDVTPESSGLAARLKGRDGEGFDPAGVAATLDDADTKSNADQLAKSTEAPANPAADADGAGDVIEAERAGRKAFHAGDPREVPEDMTLSEQAAYLHGYDAAAASVTEDGVMA